MAATTIDDVMSLFLSQPLSSFSLPSSPLLYVPSCAPDITSDAEVTCREAPSFASYCPGKLLRESLRAPSMVEPPVLVDALEFISLSTTETKPAGTPTTSMDATAKEELSKVPEIEDAVKMLSLGSIGHDGGLCRPCGFFHHKGGCSAGVDCTFCHLCPAGTIERQRKLKRQVVRAARYSQRSQGSSSGSSTPPEHDDFSQCSTADTLSAPTDSPRLVNAVPVNHAPTYVDHRRQGTCAVTGYMTNSCIGPADAASAAANAAAAATAAASALVAMRKRRTA